MGDLCVPLTDAVTAESDVTKSVMLEGMIDHHRQRRCSPNPTKNGAFMQDETIGLCAISFHK